MSSTVTTDFKLVDIKVIKLVVIIILIRLFLQWVMESLTSHTKLPWFSHSNETSSAKRLYCFFLGTIRSAKVRFLYLAEGVYWAIFYQVFMSTSCWSRSACWMLVWRFKMAQIWNRTTTSFLDFSRLEQAQVTHEHTEQPTIQLGSAFLVDATRELWDFFSSSWEKSIVAFRSYWDFL